MFSLIKGFYDLYTQKEEYSIIIIGLDNAGKTTLLESIKAIFTNIKPLAPERITPTIGLNGKILKFWDLGGQSELQIIWEKYYPASHGVLFVVDSTDEERILEAQKILISAVHHHDLRDGVPVLMLANKQDRMGESMPIEHIKTLFNPIALHLEASDATVLPISAIDGNNVRQAVDWIFYRVLRNKEHRPPNYSN